MRTAHRDGQSHGLAAVLGEDGVCRELSRRTAPLRLATLGPSGTSADEVARHLVTALHRGGAREATVVLHDTFGEVRKALHTGTATCALVPSAATGATEYHWDPGLDLLGVVLRRTPRYGLATRTGGVPGGDLVVAALPEVAALVEQLAPPPVLARPRFHRDAASTAQAARAVLDGDADVAVCNDTARARHGLHWLASREGVPMPWNVFVRRGR